MAACEGVDVTSQSSENRVNLELEQLKLNQRSSEVIAHVTPLTRNSRPPSSFLIKTIGGLIRPIVN